MNKEKLINTSIGVSVVCIIFSILIENIPLALSFLILEMLFMLPLNEMENERRKQWKDLA